MSDYDFDDGTLLNLMIELSTNQSNHYHHRHLHTYDKLKQNAINSIHRIVNDESISDSFYKSKQLHTHTNEQSIHSLHNLPIPPSMNNIKRRDICNQSINTTKLLSRIFETESYDNNININMDIDDDDDDGDMNEFNLTLYDKDSMLKTEIKEINQVDFSAMVIGRLQMFNWCSSLNYETRIDIIYNPNNLQFKNKLIEYNMSTVNDNYCHLLFRLSFCSNQSLTTWFIQRECELLRIKYCKSSLNIKHRFEQQIGVKNREKLYFSDLLSANLLNKWPIPNLTASSATIKWMPYHRIPFLDCLCLIKRRKIYLFNGFGYVPNYLFHLIVEQKYRKHLRNKLDKIKELNLLSDNFLDQHPKFAYEINKIKHIFDAFVLKKISINDYNLNRNDMNNNLHLCMSVDKYLQYFPFCIKYIFNELMTKKHIKNGGRLQLSLFLKGIGFSKKELLSFWHKYDVNYVKYSYEVSYHFERDYSAMSCASIMKQNINNKDCNGCPFKTFENNPILLTKLIKSFYNKLTIKEIENNVLHQLYHTNQCKALFNLLYLNHNNNNIAIEDIDSKWIFADKYFKIAFTLQNDMNRFSKTFLKKHITITY